MAVVLAWYSTESIGLSTTDWEGGVEKSNACQMVKTLDCVSSYNEKKCQVSNS